MIVLISIIISMIEIDDWEYEYNTMPTMMKKERKWILEQVQKELWKCDFWKPAFYKVLNRHSYQDEFYLLGSEPTPQFVDKYLHKVLKRLQGKYEVACRRVTAKDFVELNLGISYVSTHTRKRQLTTLSELDVYVDDSQIIVSLLPYSALACNYKLDEYLVVENVINDLCEELLAAPVKQISDFQNYRKKLNDDQKHLNLRAIEIARSSITSLYKKHLGSEVTLQGYLFTVLSIGGKDQCILHKDFLDNPKILISKLQKSKNSFLNIIK